MGIISQSGNLAIELALLAGEYGLGVSRFASLGNQADIEAAELVEAFAADEATRVIVVYCEDFRDGRAFARAGEAALAAGKQVVLLAAGGSPAGARAAASHTGALASDSAAIDAACRARRHPARGNAQGARRHRARLPRTTPAAGQPPRHRR